MLQNTNKKTSVQKNDKGCETLRISRQKEKAEPGRGQRRAGEPGTSPEERQEALKLSKGSKIGRIRQVVKRIQNKNKKGEKAKKQGNARGSGSRSIPLAPLRIELQEKEKMKTYLYGHPDSCNNSPEQRNEIDTNAGISRNRGFLGQKHTPVWSPYMV